MPTPLLTRSIRRVTLLEPDAAGGFAATVVFRGKKGKKKKVSRLLRPLERLTRKGAKAQREMAVTYVRRHRRSSRKKRDGWLRDLSYNVARATGNAARELRPSRLW